MKHLSDDLRMALSNTLSNVVGSAVFICLFQLFVKVGQVLFPNYAVVETLKGLVPIWGLPRTAWDKICHCGMRYDMR